MSFKQTVFNHLKNLPGWRTNRKLVLFSIDDYGNVRLDSPDALEQLKKAGVQPVGRFDHLDTMETRSDLEYLFDTLRSVKDHKGRSAVFTPYTLSGNINFRATCEQGEYIFEPLTATWERLKAEQPDAYEGIDSLWRQGIEEGIFVPQFHGREHLNLTLFTRLLEEQHPAVMENLKYKSLIGLPNHQDYPTIGFTQAYAFWDVSEVAAHKLIIQEGLEQFEAVFGFPTTAFTPPAQQLHPDLYGFVENMGVKAIDKPFYTKRHIGRGKYKRELNSLGQKRKQNHITLVRNVVFEPNNDSIGHVGKALRQIEAAFRWGKPAHISSHRVNFSGHIDPDNRKIGLSDLKELLQQIVKHWPEVEFVSVPQLVEIIEGEE